jgi:hypothetical protein
MPLSAPEPLTTAHDVSAFACGKPALDHWLHTSALYNQEKGFTVVMAVHEVGRVVGYSGLAPTAVVPTALPRSIKTGQPPTRSPASSSDYWQPTAIGPAKASAPACSATP